MAVAVREEQSVRRAQVAPGAGRLTVALLVATTLAAAGTVAFPSWLRGTDAMNGSARGTALVALLVAVPLVALSSRWARHGSERALALWIGGVAYLAYNGVMLCFATPFNRLFLLYAAMLSLAIWALVALVRTMPSSLPTGPVPRRAVGAYIGVVVVLNSLVWLRTIVPATFGDDPGSFLAETGLPVNPVHIQDLTFWLPAMALAAVLLWRAHPLGLIVAASGLVFWQVEAVGVAVDQWFGHRADPTSTVATTGAAWLFVGLFLVGLLPTLSLLRRIRS